MRKWARLLHAAVIITCSVPAAQAGFQSDVAVTGDGKTVVAFKDRTLYVIDGDTLTVRKRIWNEAKVKHLCFCNDGTKLVVADDAKRLRILDVATGAFDKELEKMDPETVSFAPAVDLAATIHSKTWTQSEIVLVSMTDAGIKARIALPEKFRTAGLALLPDGRKIIVFSHPLSDKEEKVPHAERPKDLKDLAKKEYDEKHDGQHMEILTYALPDGKLESKKETWYTLKNDTVVFTCGGDVLTVPYSNPAARIQADGSVELFKTPVFCNYGFGYSADGGSYLAGSLAAYALVRPGKKKVETEIPRDQRLPGFPEYFYGFGFALDGSAFGWTSGPRIGRIGPNGKLLKLVPVF